MQHTAPLSATPAAYLAKHSPDAPVLFIAPSVLQATARRFQADFDGLVTYAVKANDRPEVLSNLVAAGITTFDVASPAEMAAVRAVCPQAVLHYNNPVRSAAEVRAGIAAGVYSWSIDDMSELAKLRDVPRDNEVAVRFALPVKGAAYDFGSKFGAALSRRRRCCARWLRWGSPRQCVSTPARSAMIRRLGCNMSMRRRISCVRRVS